MLRPASHGARSPWRAAARRRSSGRASTGSTPRRGAAGRLGRARRCWWCSTRSTPAERLAFVLHDMFAVPFDEIATIVGRSPAAARQLASRARRRVQGAGAGAGGRSGPPARGRRRVPRRLPQRRLRRAARGARPGRRAARRRRHAARRRVGRVRGARAVAEQAVTFAQLSPFARPALVNGAAGAVVVATRPPVRGHGVHRHGREDRRDRHPLRPRPPGELQSRPRPHPLANRSSGSWLRPAGSAS